MRYKKTKRNTPEGLLPDSLGEWGVIAGSCLLGSVVPCMTGIYLRSLSANAGDAGEDLATAIFAEWCPLCSCAPCQMNQYRVKGVAVVAGML
jgi:hypothetical protein